MGERWLTVGDIAERMQLSKSSAYTYMGRMEHITEPLRVSEKVLEAWIAEHTVYPVEKKTSYKPRKIMKRG